MSQRPTDSPFDSAHESPSDGPILTDQKIAFFCKNGFLNYGPLLTPEELAELCDEVQRFIDGAYPEVHRHDLWPNKGERPTRRGQEKLLHLQSLWKHSETVRKYAAHRKKVRIAAALLGTDRVQMLSDMVIHKPPGQGKSRGTFWHQDYLSHPNSIPEVTAWLPLDEVKCAHGCMQYIPGSHLRGALAPEGPDSKEIYEQKGIDFATAEYIEMEAGDVLFHHGWVLHNSDPNATDSPRRVYINRYIPAEAVYRTVPGRDYPAGQPFDEEDFPVVLDWRNEE